MIVGEKQQDIGGHRALLRYRRADGERRIVLPFLSAFETAFSFEERNRSDRKIEPAFRRFPAEEIVYP
jgi:hypothetical protein